LALHLIASGQEDGSDDEERHQRNHLARTDAEGSHGKWTHPSGAQVSIPDGHRTISPGVVRQVNNAIKAATKHADDDKKGEDE
jgi:hypothetical protein